METTRVAVPQPMNLEESVSRLAKPQIRGLNLITGSIKSKPCTHNAARECNGVELRHQLGPARHFHHSRHHWSPRDGVVAAGQLRRPAAGGAGVHTLAVRQASAADRQRDRRGAARGILRDGRASVP